ncbi:MAG: family 43 glycosylhydrolase, partial [Clostridiaceae bacterium]|nr:family 43 glycosylhydrolase [Clostridiaceae bacterium]
AKDYEVLTLGDTSAVIENLKLPTVGQYGSTITWVSSDETVISNTGVIYAGDVDKTATLTATITRGGATLTKTFEVTVKNKGIIAETILNEVAESLTIPNADDIRGNITLPLERKGATISWATDRPDVVNVNEIVNENYDNTPPGVVTRQDTDVQVKLTATITYDGRSLTKEIPITVKAKPKNVTEDDMKAYLFTYFTGEYTANGEQIYFATSKDGLHWKELNDGNPVLTSKVGDKGVRDPYIMRSPEGDKFYMIATDLRIYNGAGWGAAQTAGSKSIVVWESTDLVNWSEERLVKVARDDAGCTWAPEFVYDEKTGEYLVFWASKVGEDNYRKHRIYAAKTRDFYTFTEPFVYLERPQDVIDLTIIKHDGYYYRFSKDEVNKNIIVDRSDQLLGKPFERVSAPVVESQAGVEGPAIFKFIGENKWCLLLDNYGGIGYYPLVSTDLASGVFRRLDPSEYSLPSSPRHGTVIQITQEEYDALMAKWNREVQKPDEEEQQEPILEYNFDETLTDRTIKDASGNNYTGTLFGNATYVTDAEKGQVLYLDGTSNTYAEFPRGFFEGRDTVTISMDIKPVTVSGNFFTFTIGKDNRKYMFLRTRDTEIRNAITVSSWQNEQEAKATTSSIRNKWMNLKLVITPTSMAIYKDGVLIAENKNVTITISDLGVDLIAYLGKSFYPEDAYFRGYFDNVKVYNRALSALEIAGEFGIKIPAVKGVSAEGYHVITSQIDTENNKIKVYFSRNNSERKDLTQVPLTYDLVEGCTLEGENGAPVDLTSPVTVKVNVPGQNQQVWTVEGVFANNPILPGLYADPDIDVFGDTFYIYPTTDGFDGWSGTQFHVFSSKDLINWKDEGVILDVATDDVPWAVGSAWAPSIEEKNGKYYFYFCAKRPDGKSCIGVAVADSPTGPFTAQPQPLITPEIASQEGISMGQTIDPSIFTDDDGRVYMLFGNGNAAIVELNEDMISYKPGTMKNISGASGIREAITVTKRDGIYHFTWSVDDTGSENYHVRYGTSNNIYGPINYRGIILQKDPSKDILGTGHHSILQIPGKDEYYIAYHRFGTPLSKYPSGKGFNRETCLDKVEFDENGYMKVITPTHEGITTPVTLDPVPVDEELTIVTSFNMSNLEPNQLLQANVDVTNHNREKGSVLVIVGLYDAQNRMVNVSYISKEIKIGESEHLRSGFRLPEDVTNHKVRVFVWDGNTLEDTSMEPLSNVVELR